MVRSMLKRLSGRTLNTSLSPDQSIAHGATYYAGMLLTNSAFAKSILNPTAAARLAQFKQRSANARALGILIRDTETGERVPHYILPANTQLPTAVSQIYGTVSRNQRRVHLRIVESGTAADSTYVELGTCLIEPLPENLPEGTEIEVTITYDEQARVHVAAKVLTTGQEAQTEIIRPENLVVSALNEGTDGSEVMIKSAPAVNPTPSPMSAYTPPPSKPVKPNLPAKPVVVNKPVIEVKPAVDERKPVAAAAPVEFPKPARSKFEQLEDSSQPIPLCNKCGEPLDSRGKCARCEVTSRAGKPTSKPVTPVRPGATGAKGAPSAPQKPSIPNTHGSNVTARSGGGSARELSEEDSIAQFLQDQSAPAVKEPIKPKIKTPPIPSKGNAPSTTNKGKSPEASVASEIQDDSEFWKILGD